MMNIREGIWKVEKQIETKCSRRRGRRDSDVVGGWEGGLGRCWDKDEK